MYKQLIVILMMLLSCTAIAQDNYASIIGISVDTTTTRRVSIVWQKGDTQPQGCLYTVYRWSVDKWIQVVDSLPSYITNYTDVVAHPFDHAECYRIATTAQGQPNSPMSLPHQTIFLTVGKYDRCLKAQELCWSAYQGAAVSKYAIYGRAQGEQYKLLGEVSDTTFVAQNLLPGTNYDFYVVAMLQTTMPFQSYSNIISCTTFGDIVVDESMLEATSIKNSLDSVEICFAIDTAPELYGYAIEVIDDKENVVFDTLFTLLQTDRLTINTPYTSNGYRVVALDYCGNYIAKSNVVFPINVVAETTAHGINIEWNSSLSTNENYLVKCSVDGGELRTIAELSSLSKYELEYSSIADDLAQKFCIVVESSLYLNKSYSNEVCVERMPEIFIPTAFSPNGDGLNDTFAPTLKSADVEVFEFVVFDRYGGRVFQTTSSNERWDGTFRGKNVAEGGYLYYVKVKLTDGQVIEKKGGVNVVYP